MPEPINVLFVTWDGPESSYIEGLFLPIFSQLKEQGFNFHVLQFTWGTKSVRFGVERFCEAKGISYRSVSVLRKPVAIGSLVTAIAGARSVRAAMRELDIDIVMPRSTLPALASMLALRDNPSVRMLFDADGLPHDERVDFGGWSADGFAYRVLRDLEALAVRRADAVLTRSKKAVEILRARAGGGTAMGKFHVVSNGRNEELFNPAWRGDRATVRDSLGIARDVPLIVFVGSSIEGKYCGREMFEFFRLVRDRRPDARMLLLTGAPLQDNAIWLDFADLRGSCVALRVAADEVPRYLCSADLGLAFIRPSFSMQAAAAIKLGEYLLCGVPVLTTPSIGDTDEILSNSVGLTMVGLLPNDLKIAADWFVDTVLVDCEGFQMRCRDVGMRYFGLENTVAKYADVLKTVAMARK